MKNFLMSCPGILVRHSFPDRATDILLTTESAMTLKLADARHAVKSQHGQRTCTAL